MAKIWFVDIPNMKWWIAEGSADLSEGKPWELDFISILKRANRISPDVVPFSH